jgi:hypothetical protein
MSGFSPERFEDMLEHRIIEARQPNAPSNQANPGI